MIELSGVNQFYGESHTLWDLDLRVPGGGCVCVMGRNGVGKTTLLKTLVGLLPVRSGKVSLDGVDITSTGAELRARSGLGYVPQGRGIFPLLTVRENLEVALAGQPRKRKRIPERVYELFPVLAQMAGRRGGDLSGGQQQQLAIGRALVLEPTVLLLDEPTEGIQPNVVQQIGDVIARLNREIAEIADAIARMRREHGMTVLLVEQKLPFARRVAEQFVLLDRGRVVADGPMSALNEELIAQYLRV